MTTAAAPIDSRTEIRTLTIISAVHLVSHLYWLALVPLLPALKALLGVSYVQLGFAITLANIVSALTQAPTGFLVDRFGARLLLVLGVATGAAGFMLVGLVPTYPALLVAAVLIGLGNAVYHPADFSILAAEMSNERMGRAFSIHTFMGYLGFALAPPVMLGLAWLGGTQFALITVGIIGVIIALPLLPDLGKERETVRARTPAQKKGGSAMELLTPAILALTLMFTVLSLSTAMMQTYMVVALANLHGVPHAIGNVALTVFFWAVVAGVLGGGFIADRASHQSNIAATGFGLAAVAVLAIGLFNPGPWPIVMLIGVAGFLAGIIMPSRDLLVRQAARPDAVGRTFGIVTTGFNFGGMIGPLIGGILIDQKLPVWIFIGSAMFMAVTIAIAVIVDRSAARPAPADREIAPPATR